MSERLGFVPDTEHPGWHVRPASEQDRFLDLFGTMRVRVEPDGTARIRIDPQPHHRNLNETVHGGFALAFIDQALFIGPAALGIEGAVGGLTIDTASQFFAQLLIDKPIDAVVEILRETGRLIFIRGVMEQDGVAAIAFSGTIKKAR